MAQVIGDGGAFGGEDPGGAVGGVWGPSDDDQQLEAGAGEACGRAVWARQQGDGTADAQKGIDDMHRKIGQLQTHSDVPPGAAQPYRHGQDLGFAIVGALRRPSPRSVRSVQRG
jgi:hypothetical protein